MAWFAVRTQPRAEEKAVRHLVNQGFAAYLPRYRRRVRHARRNEIVLRPLFPGYLFVELDPARCRWRSINGTVGVHGRGGASLLDPLGSARSHGCIRLANTAIDWLAHAVGAARLPGIPVLVH